MEDTYNVSVITCNACKASIKVSRIELALGLLFLICLQITSLRMVTLVILGITMIGAAKVVIGKTPIEHACLGTALKSPMAEPNGIANPIVIVRAVIKVFKTKTL